MKTKGVILAGGKGTRLLPATSILNKHLIPIINKPMILYPLETLKSLGITDILIVSGGNHIGTIADFLGDGEDYGVKLTYKVQREAGGIAQALLLAEDFVSDSFSVILGDNVFESVVKPTEPCSLYVKTVEDPQRFGVLHKGHIEEKPKQPKSNKVVTGLYHYPKEIFNFIKTLKPSQRGELEITDVNNWCLQNFKTEIIEVESFWSDAGTPQSLLKTIDWAKIKIC